MNYVLDRIYYDNKKLVQLVTFVLVQQEIYEKEKSKYEKT